MTTRPADDAPRLGVVVATLGLAEVEATVASLVAAAEHAAAPVQIVVVWQGADPAPELPGAEIVPAYAVNLSHARNVGLAAVRAQLAAFVDDDEQVDPGYVAGALAAFADPAVQAAFGPVAPLDDRGLAYCSFAGGVRQAVRGPATPPWNIGTGGNMAFRVPALRAIGGFDVRLGAGSPGRSGEDLEVIALLQRTEAVLLSTPDMVVYHPTKTAAERLASRYGYGFGMGRVAARLRCPRLARQVALSVAYAGREVVRRRSRRRARELAETTRGIVAGIWRGRRWFAPSPGPLPPEIEQALDGPLRPRPVPYRADPHFLYDDDGGRRLLHVYAAPDADLREALEVRRVLPRLPGIPRLHAAAEARHAVWVVEDRLEGEPVSTARRDAWWDPVVDWAAALGRTGGPPLREAAWFAPAREELPAAVAARWRTPVADALEALADVPATPAHGDLEPKNVLLDGGRVGVVDWEGARGDLPPGFDLVFLTAMANGDRPDPAGLVALAGGAEPPHGRVREALAAVGAGPARLHDVLWVSLAIWCEAETRRLARAGVAPQRPVFAALLDAVGPHLR